MEKVKIKESTIITATPEVENQHFNFIFECTDHALKRYVERVLKITYDDNYIHSHRTELTIQISHDIMSSDFVFTDYRGDGDDNVIYFMKDEVIFMIIDGHVRTIIVSNIKDKEERDYLKRMICKHRKEEGIKSINARNYGVVLISHNLIQ